MVSFDINVHRGGIRISRGRHEGRGGTVNVAMADTSGQTLSMGLVQESPEHYP